jgi:preprotein translocase subunit SecE
MADTTQLTAAPAGPAGPGTVARVGSFLQNARAEMRKVTWPSRDELVKATRMILVLSVALGVLIGLLDFVLQLILVDGVARLAR